MKGFTLLSAVALMTLAFTSVVFAQKSVISPTLTEEGVRTVTFTGRPTIHRIDLRGDFQPAQPPDPYVYLQTMFSRWNDAGVSGLSFLSFAGGRTIGDDVVLLGGAPDPGQFGYDTSTPVACISEIRLILISIDPNGGSLGLRLGIHRWNGLLTAAALAPQSGETFTVTIPNIPPAPPGGLVLIPVTVSVSPRIAVPKAFWVAMTPLPDPDSTINLANIGPLIANSTPGNVSMLPGRGYFRLATPPTAFTAVTGGSVFTGLPQGSFYLAIRGTHNFVGTVDLSALNNRAKPSSPLAFEFDDDPADDPDAGITEALRRNIVDVEVVNDSDPQNPFTSRFTTYLDENGRFTLPVTNAIASITVRRWDNGLKVTFNRPEDGWSTNVCNPTVATQTMTFGDVSGDGIIDDADLLAVLFNFGNSE